MFTIKLTEMCRCFFTACVAKASVMFFNVQRIKLNSKKYIYLQKLLLFYN